jgi:hypothetical protein
LHLLGQPSAFLASADFTHTCFGGGLDFRHDPSPNTTAESTRMLFCGTASEGGLDCNNTESVDPATSAYSTLRYSEQAKAIIGAHDFGAAPLFLYLPFQAVHSPDEVPTHYSDPYSFDHAPRNIFAGMLACLDEALGNITGALKAKVRKTPSLSRSWANFSLS